MDTESRISKKTQEIQLNKLDCIMTNMINKFIAKNKSIHQ